MTKDSEKYWQEREEEARKNHIKDEEEYRKHIESIYRQMRNEISDQIYGFYAKYSTDKGLSISEVKKKCSELDMEEYSKKAKKYVKEKDFSEQANEEMKIYNLTMKVNRLELLKAQLGLELVAGTDEIDKFLEKELEGRTLEELERQAGILGKSLVDNKRLAHSIVNASFYNATFSDRIWANQSYLKLALDKILKTALIQGRNPREFMSEITKRFDVSSAEAYRLLVTELSRVQTDAQMKSFKKNGFDQYTFHALGSACEYCREIDGKHFNVEDAEPGKNMPPMHPHCRCSTSAYMDDDLYEEWLDGYKKHGLNWEEWKNQKAEANMKSDLQYRTRYSKEGTKISRQGKEISARKILGSKNVFVEDGLELSKFEASNACQAISEAYKLIYGNKIKHKPDIYILKSDAFVGKTTGGYRWYDNSLFLNEAIF